MNILFLKKIIYLLKAYIYMPCCGTVLVLFEGRRRSCQNSIVAAGAPPTLFCIHHSFSSAPAFKVNISSPAAADILMAQ